MRERFNRSDLALIITAGIVGAGAVFFAFKIGQAFVRSIFS